MLDTTIHTHNSIAGSSTAGTERYVLRPGLEDRPGRNYYSLTLYQVVPFCKTDRGA